MAGELTTGALARGIGLVTGAGAARILAPIDNKNGLPLATGAAGVEAGLNYVMKVTNWSDKPIFNPRIIAWNSYISTLWAVVANASAVEWAAAWDTGTDRYALNFDGSATYTMAAGETMKESQSSPNVLKIDPGQTLTLRLWNHLSAGTYIAGSGYLFAALGEGLSFTGIAGNPNKTLSGTVTPADSIRPPVMVVGDMDPGGRIAVVWGHSIAQGQAENIIGAGLSHDGYGMQGVPQRILRRDGYNGFHFCRPSGRAQDVAALSLSHPCRQIQARTAERLTLLETLRNDINNNRSVIQMKADYAAIYAFSQAPQKFAIGETPVTGGDFTTVDGQTRAAGASTTQEATRVSLNTEIYTDAVTGQTGHIDVTPAEATTSAGAVQPGIRVNIAGGVYDGTHRKATSMVAIVNGAATLP